jgi:xylulokinase
MALYAGLDASTQSLTAVIVEVRESTRRVVFQHALNFDRDLPEYGTTAGVRHGDDPTVVFSPPAMWVEALDRMMAAIASSDLIVDDIRAMSGAAQQHGSVYLTSRVAELMAGADAMMPLAPQLRAMFARAEAPVWLDASTTAYCREIEATLGGADVVRALTGSPACERFTAAQIRKLAREQPLVYDATARVHLVSSFMATLLTGRDAPLDPGDASGMNLMDLANNEWSPAALEATAPGLMAKLPPIQSGSEIIGRLAPYWQKRYALPPIPIVTWTGDNPSSLVGTGIVRPGKLGVSLGTSDTVFANTAQPGTGVSHVFRSPTGEFMNLACFRNGSLAREWVRYEYRLDWNSVAALLQERPGNDGCIMLPWLEVETTPFVPYPGVRRFGFDALDAGRNVRGLVEGQMMAMANHAAGISPDPVTHIVATGGAATNHAILQVMANVFGADVHRLDVENAAALGAALRAYYAERLAAGEPMTWRSAVSGFTDPNPGHRVTPNPRLVAMYADLRRAYSTLEKLHKDRRP